MLVDISECSQFSLPPPLVPVVGSGGVQGSVQAVSLLFLFSADLSETLHMLTRLC